MEAPAARRTEQGVLSCILDFYLLLRFVAFVYMFSSRRLLVLACNNSGFLRIGAVYPAVPGFLFAPDRTKQNKFFQYSPVWSCTNHSTPDCISVLLYWSVQMLFVHTCYPDRSPDI